jgi:hypothetical protein
MEKTELIGTRRPLGPKFIYCCQERTNQILRLSLLTGQKSIHRVHGYQFKQYSTWNELPEGSLFITGGQHYPREAEKIDTLREYAVIHQPPMHTARKMHTAVYHSQYLYVLGGYNDMNLSECERYDCAESQWEVLPALPVACCDMSAVVMDNSLYALGGYDGGYLDTVQKLSLDSLTWELMQFKLPQATRSVPCFKTDTQVYLVVQRTLYSFSPPEVKPVKTIVHFIQCKTSYYNRGILYCTQSAQIKRWSFGMLA